MPRLWDDTVKGAKLCRWHVLLRHSHATPVIIVYQVKRRMQQETPLLGTYPSKQARVRTAAHRLRPTNTAVFDARVHAHTQRHVRAHSIT